MLRGSGKMGGDCIGCEGGWGRFSGRFGGRPLGKKACRDASADGPLYGKSTFANEGGGLGGGSPPMGGPGGPKPMGCTSPCGGRPEGGRGTIHGSVPLLTNAGFGIIFACGPAA